MKRVFFSFLAKITLVEIASANDCIDLKWFGGHMPLCAALPTGNWNPHFCFHTRHFQTRHFWKPLFHVWISKYWITPFWHSKCIQFCHKSVSSNFWSPTHGKPWFNSFVKKLHQSPVSEMSLTQPLKLICQQTGIFQKNNPSNRSEMLNTGYTAFGVVEWPRGLSPIVVEVERPRHRSPIHCGKFCLSSFQICTKEVWKNQKWLSKVYELPCLILIKHTGRYKTGICQVINSTRGRFQSNMEEKLTKLLI